MGGLGAASAILGAEVCAPLLLLCWLCCWPDDTSDTSSGKHPSRPVLTCELAERRRRPHELSGRRLGSSAVSLQLPGPSGSRKLPLSAHRSHEEIRARRRSQLETRDDEGRYHSAPSVIHEVLHRRDWERSAKELYIPLRPAAEAAVSGFLEPEEQPSNACKKHHTNIKCSKRKEADEDVKDDDATEAAGFYIGERRGSAVADGAKEARDGGAHRPRGPAKETKQSLNECIKSKDRMRLVPVEEFIVSRFEAVSPEAAELDRSGAQHHALSGPIGASGACPLPPPSVEPSDYESEASFAEQGAAPSPPRAWSPPGGRCVRGRHASAGDVLAPPCRPHSAALSESDIDFELEASDELPPSYHEVLLLSGRNETAI